MFVSSQNYFFSVKDVGAAVRRERIFSFLPFNLDFGSLEREAF